MARVSNTVLAIFNCITLVIGLAAIVTGVYLFAGGSTACQKGLQNPAIYTGTALFLISLLGLIGSCCRANIFLVIYLFFLFLLILVLVVFTVFAILITNEGAGEVASRTKVANFKDWIRNHFVNDQNWNQIKGCLIDAHVCKSLGNDVDHDLATFYQRNLSPVQSGCCKPPSSCGFTYQNATFWVRPKTAASSNADCVAWSNQQETLCYNCETCKAGFVDSIRKKWIHLAIFNSCVIVAVMLVYSIGCSARRNNKKGSKYRRYGGYYP